MNATVKRKRLIRNAVPTLFDIPNPPKRLTPKRPPPTPRPHVPLKSKKPKTGDENPTFGKSNKPEKGT